MSKYQQLQKLYSSIKHQHYKNFVITSRVILTRFKKHRRTRTIEKKILVNNSTRNYRRNPLPDFDDYNDERYRRISRTRMVKNRISYTLSVSMDKATFLELVSRYTENHDGEVIAKRVFPDMNYDGQRQFIHGVSTRDLTHYIAGMFKRVLPEHPIVDDEFQLFKRFFKTLVRQIEPIDFIPFLNHELTDEYWLNGTEKYNQKQISHFHDLIELFKTDPKLHELYKCKSFIKQEMYDDVKFARLINSRSDTFKVITAPYTKKIEERIFVDTFPQNFIKHKTPEWISSRLYDLLHRYGDIYETDYSSFESSFSQRILNLERFFFAHMLKNNPEVLQYVDFALSQPNHIVCSLGVDAYVPGTRMSGEMWTSLCNGFMNMALVKYVAHISGAEVDFIVEGDDGAACFSRIPDYSVVERLGFKLKLIHGSCLNDISFCGYKVRNDRKPVVDIEWVLHNLSFTRRQELISGRKNKSFVFEEYITAITYSAYLRSIYTPILNTMLYSFLKRRHVTLSMCRKYLNYWQYQQVHLFDLAQLQLPDSDDSGYKWIEDSYGISSLIIKEIEQEMSDIGFDDNIYFSLS